MGDRSKATEDLTGVIIQWPTLMASAFTLETIMVYFFKYIQGQQDVTEGHQDIDFYIQKCPPI